MIVKARIVGMALIAAILLTGCDSYSIVDQFRKDGERDSITDPETKPDPVTPPEQLTLTIEKDTVLPEGTAALYPVGGTIPYRFEVFGKDLYEGTKNNAFGTFVESTFTAGRAIGVLTIRVVDAAEKTAEVAVTVIPPTPGDPSAPDQFLTRSGDYKNVTLLWTYGDTTIIDGFNIVRTPPFASPMTVDKTLTTFTDKQVSPPTTYTYEVIAVAGSFRSAALSGISQGKP